MSESDDGRKFFALAGVVVLADELVRWVCRPFGNLFVRFSLTRLRGYGSLLALTHGRSTHKLRPVRKSS